MRVETKILNHELKFLVKLAQNIGLKELLHLIECLKVILLRKPALVHISHLHTQMPVACGSRVIYHDPSWGISDYFLLYITKETIKGCNLR
jgi:hypothetical protein